MNALRTARTPLVALLRLTSAVAGLVLTLTPATAARQVDEAGDADDRSLRPQVLVGPIPGWTTGWHPAPETLVAPPGITLRLRVESPAPDFRVQWIGARETQKSEASSSAECVLPAAGTHRLCCRVFRANGELLVEDLCLVQVGDQVPGDVRLDMASPWVPELPVDETSSNDEMVHAFFGQDSVADLLRVAPRTPGVARYRTSIEREVRCRLKALEPAALESIVEWRVDGQAVGIGPELALALPDVGVHTISVGPPDHARTFELETYAVELTDSSLKDLVFGRPYTFEAITRPGGYEDEIVWMASTKHGSASPRFGRGRSFTTTYTDIYGREKGWFGITAGNTTAHTDPPTCILEILDSACQKATFVQIGHWGADVGANSLDGYAGGVVKNAAAGVFIDTDPDRFYVRLIYPRGNEDPAVVEREYAEVRTDSDAAHPITLLETGPDTGIFKSEAQLMVTVPLKEVTDPNQDDNLAVYSVLSVGFRADETLDDRTHMDTIDGKVHALFAQGPVSCEDEVPVCQRQPEMRRKVEVRVRVYEEPFRDYGLDGNDNTNDAGEGNGVFDYLDVGEDGMPNTGDTGEGDGEHGKGEPSEPYIDLSNGGTMYISGSNPASSNGCGPVVSEAQVQCQIQRATKAWAQACIKVVQVGATINETAPNDAAGTNILDDAEFDAPTPVRGDELTAINAIGNAATFDVLEVVFAAPVDADANPGPDSNAIASIPAVHGGGFPAAHAEKTYAFIAPNLPITFRTVAHEIGHALTNQFDKANPRYVFYHATTTFQDTDVNNYRRIQHATEMSARTTRAAGDLNGTGNRLLKNP